MPWHGKKKRKRKKTLEFHLFTTFTRILCAFFDYERNLSDLFFTFLPCAFTRNDAIRRSSHFIHKIFLFALSFSNTFSTLLLKNNDDGGGMADKKKYADEEDKVP